MLMLCRSLRSFRIVAPTLCALASCLSVACHARPAAAQVPAAAPSYTWDTIGADYADRAAVTLKETEKNNIILGRSNAGAGVVVLDNWYTQYLFPSMATAEQFGDIAQKRASLVTDLERVTEPNLHQHLLDLAYDEAVKRVTGNYHPFVRYNAMLIIGSLNQTERVNLNGVIHPPVRLPRAFDFMVDQFKEPNQIDAIKLAAMVGIGRHLYLVRERSADQPIPDGRRAEVAALMKTLLDEKTVPATRPVAFHTWLRRTAADILGTMGAVGDNHDIFDSLVRIVGDAEEPLSMRCTAARTLGDLEYTDVTGIDALATARQLGALAAFACRAEDTRAKDEQKALEEELMRTVRGTGMGSPGLGGSSGYPSMPGMPGTGGSGRRPGAGGAAGSGSGSSGGSSPGVGMNIGMPDGLGGEGSTGPGLGGSGGYGSGSPYGGMGSRAAPKDEEQEDLIDRIRIRLKTPLDCALWGVRGPEQKAVTGQAPALGSIGSLAADDQQKAEITKIVAALKEIVDATDADDEGLAKMLDEVRTKTRDLEKLLPNVVVAPETPTADDDLPGPSAPADASAPAGSTPPAGAAPPAGASDPAKKAG